MPRIHDPPHRDKKHPHTVPRIFPITAIVMAYLGTFLILPHDGFWINDNGCKFIQLQGMIRTNYRDFSIPWPGQDLDPSFAYQPLPSPFGHVINGRLYGTFSPVFPMLSSFPYRLWGFHGLLLLPLASVLLTLPAVWSLTGILTESSPAQRLAQSLALLVVALGTPVWFYSMTFWEHVPAVCLATWSVAYYIQFVVRGQIRKLITAVGFCALSVYFRDELYLLAATLLVLTVSNSQRRYRLVFAFLAVFVLTVAPLWVFQWLALGHPLGHHFHTGSPFEVGFIRHLSDRWSVIASLLLNCHENTWISTAVSVPYLALWLTYPRLSAGALKFTSVLLAALATLGGATVMAGYLTADSPIWWLRHANGLFATSPILILAFVREKVRRKQPGNDPMISRKEKVQWALWLIVLMYTLFYVFLTPRSHASGIHWGCRYLLPVFPLLGVMACVTLAEWWTAFGVRDWVGTTVLCLALALTLTAQVYSLTLLYGRKQFSAELNLVVCDTKEEVVLASGWFIPQELSHCFFDKKIFLIQSQREGDRLVADLRRAGVREALVVAWPPSPDAATRAGSKVVDDGSLDFISVELQSIQLGE